MEEKLKDDKKPVPVTATAEPAAVSAPERSGGMGWLWIAPVVFCVLIVCAIVSISGGNTGEPPPADEEAAIDGRIYPEEEIVFHTGWVEQDDGWYYYDSDGYMQYGWLKDGGDWYYLMEDGRMAVGLCYVEGEGYWFNSSGAMVTGWQEEDSNGDGENDRWRYFDSEGVMVTEDWVKSGGEWYWMDDAGIMVTDVTLTIDGETYSFDSKGRME